MICPIFKAGVLSNKQDTPPGAIEQYCACSREFCTMWDPEKKQCAFLTISAAIKTVTDKLKKFPF